MSKLFINEQLFIGVKHRTDNDFSILKSPVGQFWADPFILEYKNEIFIYFESFDYSLGTGTISVGRLDPKKLIITDIRPILRGDSHYSYPQIFTNNGSIYLIPETSHKKEIGLYQIYDVPYSIKKIRVLIEDIKAVDSTIFHYDSNWYIFTSVMQDTVLDYCNKISIYCADDLINGTFSKIKDTRFEKQGLANSRMAGNIDSFGSDFIRYSQNCAERYGGEININAIKTLSPQKYEESFIGTIERPKYAKSMHTLNKSLNFVIGDFVIKIKNPFKILLLNFLRFIISIRKAFLKSDPI